MIREYVIREIEEKLEKSFLPKIRGAQPDRDKHVKHTR